MYRNPTVYRVLPLLAALFVVMTLGACAQGGETETAEATPVAESIPVTASSDAVHALLAEGHYLADVGRGVAARNKFAEAMEADPSCVQAYIYRANNALSFQDFQESLDAAAAAAENGNEAEQKLVAALQTFLTNDTDEGVALAKELVELHPNSPRAHNFLAGFQGGNNDNEAARASMAKALELDPDNAAALFGLAANNLFAEPRDLTAAEEWANKAIAAYPDEAKAYEMLGDVKRGQGDLDAALAAYNQASEVDATLAVAHHKRGHVNSFLGNIEDARAAYDEGVNAAPTENKAGYAVYKAFTRVHEGNMQAAIDELVELAAQVPEMGTPADQVKGNQIFALNSAATVALHAGMMDKAAELIEERNELAMAIAADVGTDDAERLQTANCHQWSGLLAAHAGEADDAAAMASEIEALLADDANPRKMEGVHYVLGMAALKAGDYTGAVDHLRQADYRNTMYIRYHLALAEEGAGNTDEAAKLFNDVATYNFNSVGFALVGDAAAEKVAALSNAA